MDHKSHVSWYIQKTALDYLEGIKKYREDHVSLEERVSTKDHGDLRAYVVDYIRASDDLDRDQFVYMKKAVCALRDHYAAMYDVIIKNWSLITQPRSEDSMPLMFWSVFAAAGLENGFEKPRLGFWTSKV